MGRNIIQVFGLPRSGTNFMEWTLNNNFSSVNYINIYVNKCDTKGLKEYGKWNALKHSYPNLNYSDYALVIYKSFDEWVKSMKKDRSRRGKPSEETYNEYLRIANELPKDKCIIVSFDYAYTNYEDLVKQIGTLIQIEPNEKIIQPSGRLNRGGAGAEETNEKFIL